MILAIDSSIGSSVAIVDAESGEVCGRADSDTPRGHAEVIGTLIEQALADAAAAPADITHVAAGMGPGPFTGLRIGIAAARAFAVGRGVPVVPVVSHDAAALARLDEDPGAAFAIVTDARRRENAVSAYVGLTGGLPHRIAGPQLLAHDVDPDVWLAEQLTSAREDDEFAESALASAKSHALASGSTHIPAENIGRIAQRLIRANDIPDLEPLYLRAPDARPPAPVKRVST